MVRTRSQGDAAELEERRRHEEEQRRHEEEQRRLEEERLRIEQERLKRLQKESPASPSVNASTQAHATAARQTSPGRSNRSTSSTTARLRLAELEAAEKLAELKRKELNMEADLIRKRLAAQLASIHDDDSVHEEPLSTNFTKVDDWLRTNPDGTRGERVDTLTTSQQDGTTTRGPRTERRARFEEPSPSAPVQPGAIEQLAEAISNLARPRPRYPSELPAFSGAPNEWLPFKAAMRDNTTLYGLSPAETIQRLRCCLKGEARDAVAALLHTATSPDIIMKTLEQSFGRPEIIIDRAMEELKKLPKPGSSASELNSFAIKLQNVVCVLSNMDRRGYLHNPLLTREVLEKLSPHIKSRWCDYADEHEGTTEPEIVMLSRFLMREADKALRHNYTSAATAGMSVKKEQRPVPAINKKRTNAVYAVDAPDQVDQSEQIDLCPSCDKNHPLHRCPNYKALNVAQRWDMVREKKLCFRCVDKKHKRFHCKAKLCGINQCRRPHHPTLHEEPSQPASPPATQTSHTEAVLSVAPLNATNQKTVLLKVCPVVISGPRGKVNTYALLDEGATITLIDADLATSIGAEGPSQPLHLSGVNMSGRNEESQTVTVQLRGAKQKTQHTIKARTIRNLKIHQQSLEKSLLDHDHLRDLLQEEVCYELARPGILVGADHWEIIVSRELRIGAPNQPAASRTQLGWVVHGTVPCSVIYHTENVLHVYTPDQRLHEREQHDQRLHELVDAHFRIDALGVALKERVSDANQRAMDIVKNTLKKIKGGYEVGLPWRYDNVTMPPSYEATLRRLKTIERKMDSNPNFAQEYTAQIENLLTKGYAVPSDGTEQQSPVCWYLPHFAVKNPNKPGKVRLVFDAAFQSRSVSLNDQLLEGPDLLLSLQGIIFRFREKSIAVTADIAEMFLQVKIRPEDQPAQQFLWRGQDRVNPPRQYKMTSMIFGAASSPFMAHSVRNHNAQEHAQTHPRALVAITKSHYMDDLVDSYDNEAEARCTIQELREVHTAAGFTLRGWNSSHPNVLCDVPEELQATTPTQLGAGGPESKILGLYWNPKEDELGFNTTMHRVPTDVRTQIRAPTKREALSAVMSIYDPLGLLSCYTIRAKMILQSLWRLSISWDEPIPTEEAELFATWLRQLEDITRLRLRRSYALEGHKRIELHVLCDASEQAYATVAYWQATYIDGSVKVTLVAAKAKVAPRRAQSIPRLELQAAVIGARLADVIKKEHRIDIGRSIYWTDSSTVVQWIRNDARRYTPFVAHRLGEIAELTHKNEWRWLPTEHNVADDATRYSHTPILKSDRWFQGPSFLYESEENWPTERDPTGIDEEVLHTTTQSERQHDWLPDPTRFSKYETLVRAAARVLAFTDICRRQATRMEHKHIEHAERALLQRAQEDSFGAELERIKSAHPITRASRLYRLDPVLENDLLRVRGRIGASNAPPDTKRPVILDGRHPITKLIVQREHSAAGHANRERVTNDLRQRYWVIHLRPTVRAVERNCPFCRVRRARPLPPATGDLPPARLDPFHRPFTNCGVDFFGPMMVRLGRRHEKRWGALFTCLTTRAVHIEIAASLSTDSALMALRRMAARRGWPRLMYSDNATNFRGADKELKTAYTEWAPALRDEGMMHRMEWRYIPPGAPNQGGAWERMVRSVKTALRATLREKTPPEEVLQTLMTEAEFAINARPLTYVSVSPDDPEALTPNHFLLGSSMGLPTTGPCDEADRRTWRASQALADNFWRRWVQEYLPELVPRGEPTSRRRQLQVEDIVVVVDHTLPRNVWPLGKITRVYTGPDGGVRVADVKTKTGIFRRPASKLAVLVREETPQAASGGELLRTPSHTSPSGSYGNQ